jgi:hypothetical protein
MFHGSVVSHYLATAFTPPSAPRFTGEQIAAAVAPLHERVAELEAQIAALRTR